MDSQQQKHQQHDNDDDDDDDDTAHYLRTVNAQLTQQLTSLKEELSYTRGARDVLTDQLLQLQHKLTEQTQQITVYMDERELYMDACDELSKERDMALQTLDSVNQQAMGMREQIGMNILVRVHPRTRAHVWYRTNDRYP